MRRGERTTSVPSGHHDAGFRSDIATAYRGVFGSFGAWFVIAVVVAAITAVVLAPGLALAARAVLRLTGAGAITTATLGSLVAQPLAALAFAVILIVATVVVLAQSTAIVRVAQDQQLGRVSPWRAALADSARAFGRLVRRPSSLLLVPYLLILVPLGQAGLGSVVTNWVAIPKFVTGELEKTPAGTLLVVVVLGLVWYLNCRLIGTVPIAVATRCSVPQAMARSWRATRWRLWRTVGTLLSVGIPLVITLIVLLVATLAAIAAVEAIWPDAALVAASIALATLQITSFIVIALGLALQLSAILAYMRSRGALADERMAIAALDERVDDTAGEPAVSVRRARVPRLAVAVMAVVSAAGIGAVAVGVPGVLDRVGDAAPLVLAHRGDTHAAVENTIEALDAAAAVGADLMELDVQQTSDGGWVVMHDFSLDRLAGIDGAVADMTESEAAGIPVHANGNSGVIPTMREFVRHAEELGLTLLIEIKPHGGESDDYIETFLAILDEEGVTDTSVYHTLSSQVVHDLKAARPSLVVGEILAISLGGVPETEADFVVVEEFSYSDDFRESAWDRGLGVLVWTVNEAAAMREYFRDGVDGVITDNPATALDERESVADDSSVFGRVLDAIGRFVTV